MPQPLHFFDGSEEQTLDVWGNVTVSKEYDFGNLSTPARTYNFTYLHNSTDYMENPNGVYGARYMHNRVKFVSGSTLPWSLKAFKVASGNVLTVSLPIKGST